MKKQIIYLPKYRWYVTIFYNANIYDTPVIMEALENIGCPEESLMRSYDNLVSGNANGGLTFSSAKLQESLMVIGFADTLAQFLDTATHENHHLCRHICEYYDIDPWSEEAAYLAGDIAQKMHSCLEPFMCECKKCSY